MYDNPRVGDKVQSIYKNDQGKVVEVNKKWGWFLVQYRRKEQRYDYPCQTMFKVLTNREMADARLRAENSGQTNSWRDYD